MRQMRCFSIWGQGVRNRFIRSFFFRFFQFFFSILGQKNPLFFPILLSKIKFWCKKKIDFFRFFLDFRVKNQFLVKKKSIFSVFFFSIFFDFWSSKSIFFRFFLEKIRLFFFRKFRFFFLSIFGQKSIFRVFRPEKAPKQPKMGPQWANMPKNKKGSKNSLKRGQKGIKMWSKRHQNDPEMVPKRC